MEQCNATGSSDGHIMHNVRVEDCCATYNWYCWLQCSIAQHYVQ